MKAGFASPLQAWLGRLARGFSDTDPGLSSPPPIGLPEDLRVYAIGDVHGCAALLSDLHQEIDRREAARSPGRVVEVLLGDLIDRGPDSRGVIDMLLRRSTQHVVVVLRGNHEQFMLDALADPERLHLWLRLGGLETLRSYGVAPVIPLEGDNLAETVRLARQAIPRSHLDFLERLPMIFRCDGLSFVHAGVRPGIPLDQQDLQDLMGIREPFLSHEGSHGRYVVHGHTPTPRVDVRPNRMNIDTGAYATGRLSGVILERGRFEIIQACAPGAGP